jgi:hypothetical protein
VTGESDYGRKAGELYRKMRDAHPAGQYRKILKELRNYI